LATSAAKAGFKDDGIAAVNRCATQNQHHPKSTSPKINIIQNQHHQRSTSSKINATQTQHHAKSTVPLWLVWIFDRHRLALLSILLLGLFRVFEPSGTVVARALDVVVGGYRRNQEKSAFAQLLGAAQNDLGASVVILDRSLNFNLPAFELANVAHLFKIGREHDHGEGTRLIFAEI
jgi:hypothetical protein